MISKPKLEHRAAIHYAGIRTQVPMKAFKKVIPQFTEEVFAWLDKNGIASAGAPFMRFHVIDMAADMDIEIGVPVAKPIKGDGRVTPGTIPAGNYASLIYTGGGIKANGALIDWAMAQGLQWDRWDDPKGDAFAGRYESYLTDPKEEPKKAKWKTEVAIKVKD